VTGVRPLDEGVWPVTARVDPDGVLVIGGVRVDDLVREVGTPVYALDEEDVRSRARAYRAAFPPESADVYYAGKAFLCTALVHWIEQEGLSLDVCTGGELAVARRAGFPPERMLFHGNNK
jgi:diaminopimelate decarboxylase